MMMSTGEERSSFVPVDAIQFRSIMRNPVSSVAVIATGMSGNRAGCTVTAVCSLSDSPPSLVVCLNRQSVVHRAILENRQFTLNYLTESQQDDADRLAGRLGAQGDGKFTGERWTIGPCDLPCLKNALAVLVCDLSNVTEFGSHSILCGTIREAMVQEHAKPLLYGQGRYMTAAN